MKGIAGVLFVLAFFIAFKYASTGEQGFAFLAVMTMLAAVFLVVIEPKEEAEDG